MEASLYEQDFHKWLEVTSKQLRARDVESLDWDNLLEEIEGMARMERVSVDINLYKLPKHLLFHQYWETERESSGRDWRCKILDFRFELGLYLEDSKTLRDYFAGEIDKIYPRARRAVLRMTELSDSTIPQKCCYTPEQLLDDDFFPES